MAEYIDREALLKDIEESVVFTVSRGKPSLEIRGANAITDRIKSAPASDVAEVKHGRWILGHVEPGYFTPGGNRPWVCSECGQVVSWRLDKPKENYCPNCGAKMNGGEENG